MKGAEVLLRVLARNGVHACFMNPGTSEMHFVSVLDAVPEMRPVLALFEGVATGAADGYGRMTGRPAATLLHLGPGLANGIANLHNARRAGTPLVNVVGDHATYHKRFDAPLESDIASLARPVSGWYRSTGRTATIARDAEEAVRAALGAPACVATLVLPADVSWLDADPASIGARGGAGAAGPAAVPGTQLAPPDEARLAAVARAIDSGAPAAIVLGGLSLGERGIAAATRVAARTGAKLFAEPFPGRMERGAGVPPIERLGYFGEFVQAQLGDIAHLVLVGARAPVSPFAYPDKPSDLVPRGCEVRVLAGPSEDSAAALEALADLLGADASAKAAAEEVFGSPPARPDPPSGPLNPHSFAAAIGAVLPENAVISDEAITSGFLLPGATAGAARHDLLTLSGNAIGQGLPLATGAAVACPDRPVLALEADGSAMYTIQALWTQAREGLDVTTVILDNGSYGILNIELGRVGAEAGGPVARSMLDLSHPLTDFVALSESMGVPATRAHTAEDLTEALRRSFAEDGPHLVQAILR